ncbi:three-helix bundle dimerization domain-containing protein [Streptomyces sp. NPDC059456]|uniref:three-helix bundle dimerization domain-containing protein n=1 Tax=Streptomyces sp. NPDC059456 TaxID=3346838 RepID=UPI0036C5BE3E
MSSQSGEEEAVRRVGAHLRAVYHGRQTPGQVDAALSAAVQRFQDSRIRDFVPVLTERHARSLLDRAVRAEAADPGPARQPPDAVRDGPDLSAPPGTDRAATRFARIRTALRGASPPAASS